MTLQAEEETVTRVEEGRALSERARSVVASDEDLWPEVLRLGLERLMEVERDAYVNAEPHERTESRRARRNGYRRRTLKTRAGELELAVPRTRDGELYPFLLVQYQRSEKALVAALAEWLEVEGESRRLYGAGRRLGAGPVRHGGSRWQLRGYAH